MNSPHLAVHDFQIHNIRIEQLIKNGESSGREKENAVLTVSPRWALAVYQEGTLRQM
jgi:hypothetical protein